MALKGIKSRQRGYRHGRLDQIGYQRACIYDQFGLVLVIFQGVGDRKDTIGDDRLFLKCLIIHKNIRLSTIADFLQLLTIHNCIKLYLVNSSHFETWLLKIKWAIFYWISKFLSSWNQYFESEIPSSGFYLISRCKMGEQGSAGFPSIKSNVSYFSNRDVYSFVIIQE